MMVVIGRGSGLNDWELAFANVTRSLDIPSNAKMEVFDNVNEMSI
jgi:hypothetical protein